VRFISEHKDRAEGGLRWGVESICAVLREQGWLIAPSTYYDAIGRPPSPRGRRDAMLKPAIARVHAENYDIYGARKVWLALNREGAEVARCTVARLMRELGLRGARRGKRVRTTIADPAAVSTGSTTGGFTKPAETSRPPSSKPPTTVTTAASPRSASQQNESPATPERFRLVREFAVVRSAQVPAADPRGHAFLGLRG
jgi:HTH-like domain